MTTQCEGIFVDIDTDQSSHFPSREGLQKLTLVASIVKVGLALDRYFLPSIAMPVTPERIVFAE